MSRFRTIVENIIKTFTEDAHSDNNRYKEAQQFYKDLYTKIEANGNTETTVDTAYGPLNVKLKIEDGLKNAYGYYDVDTNTINVYLDNIFTLDDKNITKNDLLDFLNTSIVKQILIHEFTHFVDHKSIYPLNKSKETAYQDYINSPSERNAYFMHWIQRLLDKLSDKYYDDNKYFPPEEKIDFLRSELSTNTNLIEYYNSLTDKNKKRFLTRLYKYLESDYDLEGKSREERDNEFFEYLSSLGA